MKVCVCLILTMHGGLIRKKPKELKAEFFVVLNAYVYDTNIFFEINVNLLRRTFYELH